MLIPDVFHLALVSEWEKPGDYERSTIDQSLAEIGFIHLSFAWQVEGVAQRFYTAVTEPLVLLRIDSQVLDLVLDQIPSGEHYPHLYGPLPKAAVVETRPFVDLTMPADWKV